MNCLSFDKAVTLTAQTFDNLTYTVKLSPHANDDFVLRFNVAGEPPKTRKPEPKEKPEDARSGIQAGSSSG